MSVRGLTKSTEKEQFKLNWLCTRNLLGEKSHQQIWRPIRDLCGGPYIRKYAVADFKALNI